MKDASLLDTPTRCLSVIDGILPEDVLKEKDIQWLRYALFCAIKNKDKRFKKRSNTNIE